MFKILILFFLYHQGQGIVRKLELVQLIWRHGDRSPVRTYPTDPNSPQIWPQGFGQLTERGMRQHYLLGNLIRQTYAGDQEHQLNLSYFYRKEEVYVTSTDVDRTLISAYSNLAGHFSSGLSNVTYPASGPWPGQWSPIPVNTIDNDRQYLMNMGLYCKAAEEAQKEYFDTDAYFLSNKTYYQPFIDFVRHQLNVSQQNFTIMDVWKLYDSIYIARNWNGTAGIQARWPKWLDQPSKLDNRRTNWYHIQQIDYLLTSGYYKPHSVAVLRGGPLLTNIIMNMDKKKLCLTNATGCLDFYRSLKYIAYSAHDTTVLAVLRTLRNAETVIHMSHTGLPKYAAAVAVELWRRDDNKFEVKVNYHAGIWYKRRLTTPLAQDEKWRTITNTIKNCDIIDTDYCTYTSFKARAQSYKVTSFDDWTAKCHNLNKYNEAKLALKHAIQYTNLRNIFRRQFGNEDSWKRYWEQLIHNIF